MKIDHLAITVSGLQRDYYESVIALWDGIELEIII